MSTYEAPATRGIVSLQRHGDVTDPEMTPVRGAPRTLTLPLVTLTTRHDMAMVLPVAGNTFERTPGNRARDVQLVPLDTVHGTLDRAMVMPPTLLGGRDDR
jgi:hypothetical protein